MFPRTQFHNLVGNNLPFLHITVGIENSDRLPFRFFRKYLLPYLLAIFRYQTVCRAYNGLGRTIVLLQFKKLGSLIQLSKFQYIVNISPSEGLNTLCIIPHYAYTLMFLGKLKHNAVLRKISILILIHQHITELLRILTADFGMIAE